MEAMVMDMVTEATMVDITMAKDLLKLSQKLRPDIFMEDMDMVAMEVMDMAVAMDMVVITEDMDMVVVLDMAATMVMVDTTMARDLLKLNPKLRPDIFMEVMDMAVDMDMVVIMEDMDMVVVMAVIMAMAG